MSGIIELIGRLEQFQSQMLQLAELISLAVQAEPVLIRRLRLQCLPHTSTAIEAELWFSPLVESRSASGLELRADARAELRRRLALDSRRLADAWDVLQVIHADAPPILQLEEKLAWLTLGKDAHDVEIKETLRSVIRAMVEEKRSGLAEWAARALPDLPANILRTEEAQMLAYAASARLEGQPMLPEEVAQHLAPEKLRALLPEDLPETFLGVRLLEDGIEFGPPSLPGAKVIRVPLVNPVVLEVTWADSPISEQFTFPLGRVAGGLIRPPPSSSSSLLEFTIKTAFEELHTVRPLRLDRPLSHSARELLERLTSSGRKHVLAIQGGGMRTTISLGLLLELENSLRQQAGQKDLRLADYFDLIGGSSAGAVIAAGLALGQEVSELIEMWQQFSGAVFSRKSGPFHELKSKFDDEKLNRSLTQVFGNRSLGDDPLRTGLCIITQRLDTDGAWSLLNHPGSRDYVHLQGIQLRDALRASMAVPNSFQPCKLQVSPSETCVFIDASIGLAIDPAMHLLLLVTAQDQPFNWRASEEDLLLVSVGSGWWDDAQPTDKLQDMNAYGWATELTSLLLSSTARRSREWLDAIAAPGVSFHTGEAGRSIALSSNPSCQLVRLNVELNESALQRLGFHHLTQKLPELRRLDQGDYLADYLSVSRAAASEQLPLVSLPPHRVANPPPPSRSGPRPSNPHISRRKKK